ncbi:M12 family metallopeptidase [Pendulispora brunnea]|uniref:M12 family metallopeptidase n=1 Tax=Pendulispora brunnea TaxID=2905690 RepID=A0ABZ2JXJ8_9BACT
MGETGEPAKIEYSVKDGLALYEGDILLGTPATQATPRIAGWLDADIVRSQPAPATKYRWPDKTVPYVIDAELSDRSRITRAITQWETKTPLVFVARTPANAAAYPDYVVFRSGKGCHSSVGRIGGPQYVSLSSHCTTNNTIHEIGHAVGLWHSPHDDASIMRDGGQRETLSAGDIEVVKRLYP